ncbi:crotonase/enoyl-CoA hydratase family protein [Rhodobacter sp. Har01]|uniref:crotonase/enoyl-CoA hydratase family protein n=1 Tax=Rhodobacter sp. Har01 TaxID=2883999 RepID=UPI001D06E78A|nr:crotonase/enoyl-CoA hydratase family protein [Rhodobacter sp. Har01]MCB6176946.1 crotonase/enoyl-CoA hydratase family protein [Rhodobacter sp. Har01]
MTYETLSVTADASGIVHLALNRPDKRNALSAQMIADLTAFAAAAAPRRDWRAVILSGAGDVFCAGGDLDWMRAQIAADRATRMSEARKLADMLKALNELPQPLIGAVQGGAYGGGVGLAAVCDTVVAAEDARFGLTETRLGLIPATIGPYVIARMGEGRARRVFFSARLFGAAEARDLGLVARIVATADLAQAAIEEASPYLATAPGAVAAAKRLARQLGQGGTTEAAVEASITALADAWEAPEAAEGIAAFFGKRRPAWDRAPSG